MHETHDTPPTSTESAADPEVASPDARPIRERRLVAFAVGLLCVVLAGFLAWAWWSWREANTGPASGPAFVERWQKTVDAHPDDLRARVELAYALRSVEKYVLALEQLDYVLKREPRNTAALYNRAMVYLSIGAGKRAEKDLWVVLDAEPDHAAAAVALGDYYAEKEQYRSLLVAVRPVLDKQPNDARLHYLTGLGYENTGHPDWAEARYRIALKINPDLLEAREGLERLQADR